MFDARVLTLTKGSLEHWARSLDRQGVKADQVTWIGFILGMLSLPMIVFIDPLWAIIPMALNRIADGLDGTLARMQGPTDRGAFLDIALDFIFYASIPLAFALRDPTHNGHAAAILLFSFIGTGTSFLAYAILAQKRQMTSLAFPKKGFFYLGGLTEATETMFCFLLFCLFPDWFVPLALLFSALCMITTGLRIRAGFSSFD